MAKTRTRVNLKSFRLYRKLCYQRSQTYNYVYLTNRGQKICHKFRQHGGLQHVISCLFVCLPACLSTFLALSLGESLVLMPSYIFALQRIIHWERIKRCLALHCQPWQRTGGRPVARFRWVARVASGRKISDMELPNSGDFHASHLNGEPSHNSETMFLIIGLTSFGLLSNASW